MTHEDQIDDHPAFLAAAERAEWKLEDYFHRADLSGLFDRDAPLDMDMGCGEGAFILAMARRHPERNFLCTERLRGRVEKVCRNAARHGLANVRVLRLESAWTARHVLPPETISVAYISFPDPWPKRHHQPRRLIQDDFLVAMHGVLVPGGELRLKTDDLPYFQWMENVIGRASGFERVEWTEEEGYPITNFESKFLSQGLPIYRALLRKV